MWLTLVNDLEQRLLTAAVFTKCNKKWSFVRQQRWRRGSSGTPITNNNLSHAALNPQQLLWISLANWRGGLFPACSPPCLTAVLEDLSKQAGLLVVEGQSSNAGSERARRLLQRKTEQHFQQQRRSKNLPESHHKVFSYCLCDHGSFPERSDATAFLKGMISAVFLPGQEAASILCFWNSTSLFSKNYSFPLKTLTPHIGADVSLTCNTPLP